MFTREIYRIDKIVVKRLLDKLGEDFLTNHTTGSEKDFIEYFNRGDFSFGQVRCYINLPGLQESLSFRANVSIEDSVALKEKFEKINSELKIIQKSVAEEELDGSYNIEKYLRLSCVGSNIGIKNLIVNERNKFKEEEEERKAILEEQRRFEQDDDYRKECLWFDKEERPFGGAFESIDSYYNFIGLK